jgi:nucleoside-diphosphate-sugar epimerase
MNEADLSGHLTLKEGDLFRPGSYDESFRECAAVIHTDTPKTNSGATLEEVYGGCCTQIEHVVESVRRAGTVKRFVYTSSMAAVSYPAPEGYAFTESDWCGDEVEDYARGYKGMFPGKLSAAYAMGKANTERKLYRVTEEEGSFEAMGIMPGYVIGPVMCENHDRARSFQNCIKKMFMGEPYTKGPSGRMQWNIIDVRDIARAHRLCMESAIARNGSRYIIAAAADSGILFTWQMQTKMKELFPQFGDIGGEEMVDSKPAERRPDNQRYYSRLAMRKLSLKQYTVNETIKATGDSYIALGLPPNA